LRELERYLSGQAALSPGLSELERESERRGREILRLALQAHIDARDHGDGGAARRSTRSTPSCASPPGSEATSASAG
jgi:hypothetical protein